MGDSTSWNPQGLSRPVMGLLYLYLYSDMWSTLTACSDRSGTVRMTQHWDAFAQPLLLWKSNEGITYSDCVSIALGIQHAHAPYCHLCPVPLHNIFPHYLIKGTIFGEKCLNIKMCVLILSTTPVWKCSHYNKNSARCYHKCTYIGLHVKCQWHLLDFSETCVFFIDFRKILSTKLHECPSIGSRDSSSRRAGGRTDRHDKANGFSSQFLWG